MRKLLLFILFPFFIWAQNRYSHDYTQGNDYTIYPTGNYRSSDTTGFISCWIKLNAVGATQTIWCSADEASTTRYIFFRLDATNQLEILQRNNDTADQVSFTTTTFTTGKWYHIVLSTAGLGTSWKCWVDGVPQTASVDGGANNGDWMNATSARDNFVLGILKRTTLAQAFDGWIDEVIYLSSEATQAIVDGIYNNGRPKDESSLSPISYWRFREGTGQSVNDEGSGNTDLQLGSGSGADAFDPAWSTVTPTWDFGEKTFWGYSKPLGFKGF